MRLVCPKCHAEYDVDDALIPDEGREVQCAACQNIWFQEKQVSPPPLILKAAPVAAPPPPQPAPPQPAPPPPPSQPAAAPPAPEPAPEAGPTPETGPAPDPVEAPEAAPRRPRPSPFQKISQSPFGERPQRPASPPPTQPATPATPNPAPNPAAPRRAADAVTPDERQFLRQAAEEELARARQGAPDPAQRFDPFEAAGVSSLPPRTETPPPSAPITRTPEARSSDEEALLKSLREQLALGDDEDEPAETPARPPTGRRSVVEAAAQAGITGIQEEPAASKTTGARPARGYDTGGETDPYEFREPRRGRGGSVGLFLALTLGLLALGVYRFEGRIAEAVPDAAPYLTQYVAAVDSGRSTVEALYIELRQTIARWSEQADSAPS